MMHPLDVAFGHAFRFRRFYTEGFGAGDRDLLAEVVDPANFTGLDELEVNLTEPRVENEVVVREGRFRSPSAERLPPEAQEAVFRWLAPTGETRGTCLLLAASSEEGYARREHFARPLVAAGIGCVLLENAFYGLRRPRGQRKAQLRTVADQLAMNHAAINEARAMLRWLKEREGAPLGVSGFSMGGHMAVMVAGFTRFPLALSAFATGRSPGPIYTRSALSWSIDWRRLAREHDAPRDRMFAIFDGGMASLRPPAQGSAVALVAARRDGFVEAREVERLHALLGGSLQWVPGGHVTFYVRGGDVMRSAILDTFARLAIAPH